MKKNVVYDTERGQMCFGNECVMSGTIPIGTDRQVLGYVNGQPSSVTLGWKQFSDLSTPPPFEAGVLSGMTFNDDGSAMYYFQELNNAVEALAKENTIPVYGANGVLKVSNGIANNDTVSIEQFNALVARVTALETS